MSILLGLARSAGRVVRGLLREDSAVSKELADAGKRGGYLCIARPDGVPLMIMSVGEPTEDKIPRYLEFCEEKARRLGSNPSHVLSFESRDPDNDKWGGAVRGEDCIVSFSGFPERLDEVVSAMVLASGGLSFNEVMERLGDNPYVAKIGHRDLAALYD